MLRNKTTLILLGLAGAYAAYRFSTMSPEQKEGVKSKVMKLVENYLPEELKGLLGGEMESENSAKANSAATTGS